MEQTIFTYLGVLLVVVLCGILIYFLAIRPLPERYRIDEAAPPARLDRERTIGIEVGLPPAEALNRAVEAMTPRGYSLENKTENTVTFTRHEGADWAVGCILMLLLILPGLLYMLLYSSTRRLTLAAYPSDETPGVTRLVIGGDDGMGIKELRNWARSLPTEVSEGSQHSTEPEAQPETPSPSGIADKLRELTELKNAGLITEEEFVAKRKNLLDRM